MHFTRREFLRAGGLLAAGAGLAGTYGRVFAEGLSRLAGGAPRVLWLQGQSCSGCSVSLLNTDHPTATELLTEIISLVFHQTVSAAQGGLVRETVEKAVGEGDYILVLEGSVPLAVPEACTLYGWPLTEILPDVIRRARAVAAVGTCAAFGGIPAAEGNTTGAASVREFMESRDLPVRGRLVNLPSCPAHPKSIVGTVAYLAGRGLPKVDPNLLTPTMFYGHCLHDECPRFHYWEKHKFATHFGDEEGCLFKLGCLGPLSYTNCSRRQWNGGVNYCIRAAAPCIGCSSPHFARRRDFPFYRKGEQAHPVRYRESDRKGARS